MDLLSAAATPGLVAPSASHVASAANARMARNVGRWLEALRFSPTHLWAFVLRLGRKTTILRHTGATGPIYKTAQYGVDIWSSLGALDLSPVDLVRYDIWTK